MSRLVLLLSIIFGLAQAASTTRSFFAEKVAAYCEHVSTFKADIKGAKLTNMLSQLTAENLLGKGSFGEVYKVLYRKYPPSFVAVKKFGKLAEFAPVLEKFDAIIMRNHNGVMIDQSQFNSQDKNLFGLVTSDFEKIFKNIKNEIVTNRHFSGADRNHEFVPNYYGCAYDDDFNVYIVMEKLMADLDEAAARTVYREKKFGDRLKILLQMARGVQFLYHAASDGAEGFIHCDIKPENFMVVDDNMTKIKIVDFSFTTPRGQYCVGGNEAYSAIEFIEQNKWDSPELHKNLIESEKSFYHSVSASESSLSRSVEFFDKMSQFLFDGHSDKNDVYGLALVFLDMEEESEFNDTQSYTKYEKCKSKLIASCHGVLRFKISEYIEKLRKKRENALAVDTLETALIGMTQMTRFDRFDIDTAVYFLKSAVDSATKKLKVV